MVISKLFVYLFFFLRQNLMQLRLAQNSYEAEDSLNS